VKTLLACSLSLLVPAALLSGLARGGDAPSTQSLTIGYHVEKLDSLGGSSSAGHGINDRGWITGRSNLPDGTRRATLWRHGRIDNLGTLGGRNSAIIWPVKNLRGIVVGITQTGEDDPHDEPWSCAPFLGVGGTGQRCVGFVWENGTMRALDTLGGTHGFATGANNFGQIVGWAENGIADPSCNNTTQFFQFRAAIWNRHGRVVRQLPPLPGHSTTAATAINDRGQVVGISGECDQAVGRRSAIDAVVWEYGVPRRLDDFGGTAWDTPMAINQRGDIVGFLNASAADGDNLNPRAALWLRGRPVMNLGFIDDGDDNATAYGINEWRQVVGESCAGGNCRAFLWQNGEMKLLQDLVVSGDTLALLRARDIDDFGRITGQAFDDATGTFVAFVATPKLVRR
jgi:probable HAF family extracellular repeat protein